MTIDQQLATARLQGQIDAAAAAGGGQVRIPAGVHRTGALRLRSGIDLHLEAGAVLQFVADPELYPPVEARFEGAVGTVHSPCLFAHGEKDVSITGLGTIDGAGQPWWDLSRHRPEELEHPRPALIGLHECERVTVRDVALRNSPAWTVHPALCEDVTVAGVSIRNPADSPNTDGINPESCRNVRISDCYIDVGDDCIAIKAGTERTPDRVATENVTITGCTMVRGHGGVVIGSEMSGGVRNVVISTCVFQGTDRGIRIKTRRDRGGTVENLRVTGVVMDDVMCPVTVNPFYFCGPDGKQSHVGDRSARPVDAGTPHLRSLHLAHLTATNVHASAGHIFGLPEAPLQDLSLHDVTISFAEQPRSAAPEMALDVPERTRAGIELGFVDGASLSRVRVRGAAGQAVLATECTDLELDVRGSDVHDD